ncbi:MAG: hypothetical protein ACI379_03325 [Nocardioides sp.]|uniref:hypothetical protein n=1 Tax=Nocardioides sp. TaxID=35761 RepID=UPI003EFD5F66
MGEPTEGMKQIAEVTGLRAQRDGLTARLGEAQRAEAELSARSDEATASLTKERADVAALESLSMTRVLAGLKGTRASDLDREQSEAAAAEYVAAEALARLQGASRETASLRSAVHALGDLDARWEKALALRESELTSGAGGGQTRLGEVLPALATARAQLVEVNQALDASEHAIQALERAREKISKAGSWATYDTFFDGGLFGDAMKYERLDEAAALMRGADDALRHLSVELADVGIGSVGELGITSMTRTFDVWFDNIFSDMSVRNRIGEAGQRIDQVGRVVSDVARDLAARRAALVTQIDELAREREQLVAG